MAAAANKESARDTQHHGDDPPKIYSSRPASPAALRGSPKHSLIDRERDELQREERAREARRAASNARYDAPDFSPSIDAEIAAPDALGALFSMDASADTQLQLFHAPQIAHEADPNKTLHGGQDTSPTGPVQLPAPAAAPLDHVERRSAPPRAPADPAATDLQSGTKKFKKQRNTKGNVPANSQPGAPPLGRVAAPDAQVACHIASAPYPTQDTDNAEQRTQRRHQPLGDDRNTHQSERQPPGAKDGRAGSGDATVACRQPSPTSRAGSRQPPATAGPEHHKPTQAGTAELCDKPAAPPTTGAAVVISVKIGEDSDGDQDFSKFSPPPPAPARAPTRPAVPHIPASPAALSNAQQLAGPATHGAASPELCASTTASAQNTPKKDPAPGKRRKGSSDSSTDDDIAAKRKDDAGDTRSSSRATSSSSSNPSSDTEWTPVASATARMERLQASYADTLKRGAPAKNPAPAPPAAAPSAKTAASNTPKTGRPPKKQPLTGANIAPLGKASKQTPSSSAPAQRPSKPATAASTTAGKTTTSGTKAAKTAKTGKPTTQQEEPPATPLPAPAVAPAIATWANVTCQLCNSQPFNNTQDLLEHWLDNHSLDGYARHLSATLLAHGLTACPDCAKIYLPGRVHPKGDVCKLRRYRESAKYLQSRKLALVTCIQPRDILTQEDAAFTPIDTLMSAPTGRTHELDSNRLQQETFRMIFILAAHAVMLADTEDDKIKAWTWLLQLPALALPANASDSDIDQRMYLLMQGRTTAVHQLNGIPAKKKQRAANQHLLDDSSVAIQARNLLRASGMVGKTADRLENPAAPLEFNQDTYPLVQELLLTDNDKQPTHPLFDLDADTAPTMDSDSVKRAVMHMNNSAPAITGWSPALIKVAAGSDQGLESVTYIANQVLHNTMPALISRAIHRQRLLLLSKYPKEGVRPILISDAWIRLAETAVAAELPQLAVHMTPVQLAVGAPCGMEHIIHLSRAALDANTANVLVKTDFKNAFGSIYKSALFDAVDHYCRPEQSRMLRYYMDTHMRGSSTYLASDGSTHTYNRGVAQGSPLSMFLFCNAVHQHLMSCTDRGAGLNHRSRYIVTAYADDTTFVGEPATVLDAVQQYARAVASIGISMRPEKTTIVATTEQARSAVTTLTAGTNYPAPVLVTDLLGTPVGDAEEERLALLDTLGVATIDRVNLMGDGQAQLLVLRQCINTKNTHIARTSTPDASRSALAISKDHIEGAVEVLSGAKALNSTQQLQVQLPTTLGGLGITNLFEIRHAAYYASASYALSTWAAHLGATHDVICSWVSADSRSGQQLEQCRVKLLEAAQEYNTGKIVPANKFGTDHANKADPEEFIDSSPPPALPNSIKQIVRIAPDQLRFKKLQRDLARVMHINAYRCMWSNIQHSDTATRARILANTVPCSMMWSQVVPNNQKFRFNDLDFKIMVLQYLCCDADVMDMLELPHGELEAIKCICAKDALVTDPADEDPDDQLDPNSSKNHKALISHLYNCQSADAFTNKHTAVVNVFADAARSAGLQPKLEQECSIQTVTQGANGQQLAKKRFDISIAGIETDSKILQCDVSVVSHRRREYADGGARWCLYAADKCYRRKMDKYQGNVYTDSEIIVPLVAETSGATHFYMRQLMSLLGARCNNAAPIGAPSCTPTFTTFWTATLICTLQRETARTLLRLARGAHQRAGLHTAGIASTHNSDDAADNRQ